MSPILFLDFDGVLHPDFCSGDHFSRAPALEVALKGASVDIVISSDWRLKRSLPELKSLLPDGIATHIVGVTGWHPHGNYRRYREITMWLSAAGRMETPWIALDDSSELFPRDFQGLIWCDPHEGFSEDEALSLAQWLSNPVKVSVELDDEWQRENLTRMTRDELRSLLSWYRASGHEDRFNLQKYVDQLGP